MLAGFTPSNILENIDLVLSVLEIESVRQWRMQEDAGDGGVLIELLDGGVKLFTRGGGGEGAQFVIDADMGAGFLLILGIHLRGRIVANEDGDQSHRFVLRFQRGNLDSDLIADLRGEGLAIY